MIIDLYKQHPKLTEILSILNENKNIHLKGLQASAFHVFLASIESFTPKKFIIVYPDKEEAMYAYTDFITLLNENNIIYFPSSYKRKLRNQYFDNTQVILRNEAINKIKNNNFKIIITYPEAICEKIIDKNYYNNAVFTLNVNEQIDLDFFDQILEEFQFELVDFVYKPGQYAKRGAIIDVFSYDTENPYRIEFRNDNVASLRIFDIETQTSINEVQSITICPNFIVNYQQHLSNSLFDYIESSYTILTKDTAFYEAQINQFINDRFIHHDENEKKLPIFSYNELITIFSKSQWFEIGQAIQHNIPIVQFNTLPQPNFNKNFDIVKEDILQKHHDSYRIFILVNEENQKQRLKDIFSSYQIIDLVEFSETVLSAGFIDNDLKLVVYNEHQFFNKFYRHKVRDRFLQKENITLHELTSLKPGDYIVHIDHGIGIFAGLERIEINGKWQEQIKLIFKDNAEVYVSVHNLHKISKYRGKDSIPPKLSKIGSGAWQKLKSQTKEKVKDIARDLIKLYAERMQQKGFAFSPDSYLQEELEASFFFEDTPDQAKATRAIKSDMEKPIPMDRLICGDVGFGKTELAIRAAFKAVADNKQVAVLVPTTILAFQHYLTFKERLEKFPCTIEYLSRLKTPKQEKEIIEKLKNGKIDIIIGTHILLGKDIQFKDLGLLIIDEEQKFGVAAKEKLRQLKTNVDTLTLTATPIPRTLQFSLIGARDLSVLQTPPANRQPIVTEIHTFNKEIIKKAIDFELSRGGQVFFIHNRVQTIHEIEKLIRDLFPDINIAIGHGQMPPKQLEDIMIKFIDGYYDILIATSIIENGIDIPNANTIIINNGHLFGLSDLHQLRGRVGRTNRKAFCYILTPPFDTLPVESRKRLKAIEEYNDLGSGFYIALQDLDIRGAGNLLGAEQSGFIAEMGYDTYQKILQEAIQEIQAEENIVINQEITSKPKNIFQIECSFETDLPIYFPEHYIENVAERIRLYKELDQIEDLEEINKFIQYLSDRFGPVPQEAIRLIEAIKIRWLGQQIGFEKISLKLNVLNCYFISNKQSQYYESSTFKKILNYLQNEHHTLTLKEKNERLYIQAQNITTLNQVENILKQIQNYINS